MQQTKRNIVTSSYPPASKQEHDAAQQQRSAFIHPSVSWISNGVLSRCNDLKSSIIFKDLQRTTTEITKGIMHWHHGTGPNPKPENGIVNRHEHGLDPVDWKSFSNDCKLLSFPRCHKQHKRQL